MRRLHMVFAALALTCGVLAPVPASSASGTSERVTHERPTQERWGRYPTRLKCDDGGEQCTRLNRRLSTKFVPTWSGVVENKTNRWIRGAQCKSRVSKTTTWGLSTSLSAELKAGIFGSINASVTGSVEKSMTSEIEFSVPFDVPPHTNTACTQGFAVFRWEALFFDRVRQSAYDFTVKAPRRVSWRIQDIR